MKEIVEKILEEELGEEEGPEGAEGSGPETEEGRDAPGQVSAEDFNPTLYSLDPQEMARMEEEIRFEMERDLRGDVLAALEAGVEQ